MQSCLRIWLLRCAVAYCVALPGCHPEVSSTPQVVNNFIGMISNADGTPAVGASIAIISLTTAIQVAIGTADRSGAFHISLPAGDYAITVTSEHGFATLNKHSI